MMKKTGIIFLILVFYSKLFCQVTQKDIYEAVNQLIEINGVNSLCKSSKPISITYPSKNEFLIYCINFGSEKITFSQIDSLFLIQQVKNNHSIKWNKCHILTKIKLKNKGIDYFTIPLFLNKNKNLFIVYHSVYIGQTNAQGTFEMYKKVNGSWKMINISLQWVS